MIPKDPLLRRNEAIDLWGMGAIDPLSLYIALDYPDNKLPLAASEVMEIRGTRLGNALNPDLAVVLQNPSGGSPRVRLDFEQRIVNGESAYVWKVEEAR